MLLAVGSFIILNGETRMGSHLVGNAPPGHIITLETNTLDGNAPWQLCGAGGFRHSHLEETLSVCSLM